MVVVFNKINDWALEKLQPGVLQWTKYHHAFFFWRSKRKYRNKIFYVIFPSYRYKDCNVLFNFFGYCGTSYNTCRISKSYCPFRFRKRTLLVSIIMRHCVIGRMDESLAYSGIDSEGVVWKWKWINRYNIFYPNVPLYKDLECYVFSRSIFIIWCTRKTFCWWVS